MGGTYQVSSLGRKRLTVTATDNFSFEKHFKCVGRVAIDRYHIAVKFKYATRRHAPKMIRPLRTTPATSNDSRNKPIAGEYQQLNACIFDQAPHRTMWGGYRLQHV